MARYLDVHPVDPQPRAIAPGGPADPRRGPDRLPDRLRLRARLPPGQPGGQGPDPAHPPPRRQAPLHAGVRRLRPARPVRAHRQRGVPRDQGRDARALHVHPARPPRRCRGGCCTRRRRPSACGSPTTAVVQALLAELGEPLLSSTLILPGETEPDGRGLGDQGGARPRRSTPWSTRGSAAPSRPRSSTAPTGTPRSSASAPEIPAASSEPTHLHLLVGVGVAAEQAAVGAGRGR